MVFNDHSMDNLGKPFSKSLKKLISEQRVSNDELHLYCLYALRQCLEHGNTGFAPRLLEMLGNRHVTKRKIAWWFCKFGMFRINKEGRLEYRKRRNMTEEGFMESLAKANVDPFYSISAESIDIPKLTTTPVRVKLGVEREKGVASTSVWSVSGGLPTLGKRR